MRCDDGLHATVWAACEAFRGDMSWTECRDHALALIFLKYMSDVWHKMYAQSITVFGNEDGQTDDLIRRAMIRFRFYLPNIEVHDFKGARLSDKFLADIYSISQRRDQMDVGFMIDRTLAALEKTNVPKLNNLFQHLCFNGEVVLGNGTRAIMRLRTLLLFLAELDMRAQMWAYPALFLFLIERFALENDSTPETPREIARLLAHLAKPCPREHVADPVCASASLLLAATHHGVPLVLAGQEAAGNLWAIARMNLLVHEQDDSIIQWGDGLCEPKLLDGQQLHQFDVVLANPPQDNAAWLAARPTGQAAHDVWSRFERGLPSKTRVDYAWISHCLAMTRPGSGRLAIIVPQTILYGADVEGRIRRRLLEENLLDTVILLPADVLPAAPVPMLVCLFDRAREAGGARAHVRDVLLVDASGAIGPHKQLRVLPAGQVDEIVVYVAFRQTWEPHCYLASSEEIAANDYDLSLPRYQLAHKKAPPPDMQEASQQIAKLGQDLLELQNKMTQQLATLAS